MYGTHDCIDTISGPGNRLALAPIGQRVDDLPATTLLAELFVRRPARAVGRILMAALDTLLTWQQRAFDRRLLAEMDMRQLQDIGLCRDDIQAEIAKPFWR